MAQKKKSRVVLTVILILAIAILIFAAYQLISIFLEYQRGESEYHDLAVQYVSPIASSIVEEETAAPVTVDFESLQSLNPDICAWINISDTVIDYPVVQGEDNDEYMYKTFRGQDNKAGSIFLEASNQNDFSDRNTVVYGHNMKNGSMFHDLEKFKEEDFFRAHPTFAIYLPGGDYLTCEIFSAHVAGAADGYHQTFFSSDEEFLAFVEEMRSLSMYSSDLTVDASDRIVTLSTCSYEFNDARMVIHAKIIEQSS